MEKHDKNLLLIVVAVVAVFILLNVGVFYRNSPTGLAAYDENNTAPVWVSNTTSFGINKGTELVVNLSEYFADADSDTLGFVATEPSNFTVSLAEDILTVVPDDDFVGTRPVTVTASDENNITSQTVLVDVLSAEREIRDDNEKYYGKKVTDEPEFETHFSSIQKTDTQLSVVFYHDSPVPQPLWVEGDVAYALSAEQSSALEEVNLVVELVDGIVPKFKLHVGSSSEVFEFGKQIPSVDVADANYSLIDRDDELIDVEVSGKESAAVIKGTSVSAIQARSGSISDKRIRTGVFAAENISMEEAIISLPASGDVNAILECSDFNVDTFVCEGEWQATDIPFSLTDSGVVFTVDHFSGYAGGFIQVINLQSYPTINSNWTVRFNTTGTANLTITGAGGTQFTVDLQFLELRCGNQTINASYDGSKVFVSNFSCNETAYETSKVITNGRHHLNFTFGNSSAVAHNLVVAGANNVTSLLNASFFAETFGDSAGYAILLTDVDNDGSSDLVVGAPHRNESNKSFRGKLYLRYGPFPNGTYNLSTANASWVGAFNFSSLGFSLAKGDFNGDGNADILAGAYLDNSSTVARSGSAYLINGGSLSGASKDLSSAANYHARFSGTLNLGNFGWSVVSGDFNNDSVLDVAVGEPAPFVPPALSNGTVYVFFGPFAAGNYTTAAANVSIQGTINISMRFGQALAVGDVNGDGADDLIVGAPDGGSSTEGEAYVFLGPLGPVPPVLNDTNANITVFAEAGIASQTGFSLHSGLDVNNDTFDDILVGDPNATNPAGGADAGKVYLIYGNASLPANITLSYNASWFGTAAKDNLGYSVLLSDENNDTLADVVMGAPGNDRGANNAGSVYFDYAPVPSAVFNVSNVNGSLFGAAAGQLIGTSLGSGSFGTGGATPEPSSQGDVVFVEGFTPKPAPAPTPRPLRKTGGGGGVRNIVESDNCISAQITGAYRTIINDAPAVAVQGTAKPDNNLDAVILQITAPYSDTVVHSSSVQTVPVDSLGEWEATLPLTDLQGTGIVSVYNDFDICAEKELCKRISLEETRPFRLEENFYEKDFSMQGSRNLNDNKIHVYYSADENYRSEQLPAQAEIEYCNGVENIKVYEDIDWVLADGMSSGALTTAGLCGYCAAVYAGASEDQSATPTTMAVAGITGSAAAITGSAVSGSPAGAETDFPGLGVMPQVLGGGSGTWLGHAEFDESIEGECRLSTQRPSSGSADAITGAVAGITGMSVDTPEDGAGGDSSLPSGGTPVGFPSGRETEDRPNAKEDSSDLGDVLPECSPFNHNPEPEPPETVSPGPRGEDGIVVSPPIVEEPGGVTFPGDVPDVDLPGEGEPEPDGLGEYEGPGGTPVAYGCQVDSDCPPDTECIEGKCIFRETPGAPQPAPSGGRLPGVSGAPTYSISSSQVINMFFPGVYAENNWVMGQGLVDKCADPAVQDACSAMYESGYEYFTPQELLSFDASSNEVTGSAVAGGSAAGCAGQGDSYNCGTGIGSDTGGDYDSQIHLSMMNNAKGAKEHCGGIIGCFPCPLSITPRRTPEWEQPSNPSMGEDEPGCGWLHYCGVDGDLHTLFYGPEGITSPTGFVVPPLEEFEPGLFAAFKNMITGSAVASAELPQADLLGTVQDLAYDTYENQGEANELCVEKDGVCGPDGRCMGLCPEIPGPPEPPVPPEIPGPPVPPQPPQPPGPPGPLPTPPPVPGPDDVVDTDDVNDMPSYCSAVTWREKDGVISGKMLDKDVPVPDGYELIAGPVSFDCEYDDLDLKFNVPDNFKDIRAFRCMDGRCTAVSDVAVFTDELVCDGVPISTYRRQEMLSGDTYLPVEEIEAIEHYEVLVSSGRKSLSTEGYTFEFTGDAPVGAMVGMFSPDFDVPLAANPSIAIISTPLVVEFGQEIPDSINARISMPFEYSENFIEGSIAVYLMQEDGSWLHLDSTLGNNTVSAYLYNIADYVENDRLVFAVMAVKCEACIVSEFERVYAPDSRDAIVLVHGLTSSAETWQFLIDDYMFNRQPWQIWTFDYPSYMTVDEMAKDLADSIQQNNDEFDRIYIVGHSLGGFIGQRALEIADENPSVYSFIRKVRKVILAGNPGKGSPAAEVYDTLFNELVNMRSIARVFDLNAEVIDDLVEGREFRRVPGIKYYAIVGTKPYEFNLGFFTITSGEVFELLGVNDGIVTADSASFVGGEYLDELCKDYFEIKLTHTELIDETIPRRTIERIISAENAAENPDTAYIGYDKYVDLMVDQCSPYEHFIIVGKRISELETPAPLNCNCGNGVCGEGETAENCPQDCAVVSLAMFCAWVPLLLLLLLLLLVILSFVYIIRRRVQKKEAGSVWKTLLWFLILLILIITLLLWFVCAYWSWINWFVLIAVAVVLVIDALVPWGPKKEGKLEEVKSPVKK